MQRIHFSATEPFLLGDGLADALLDYALALAQYRRHDLVHLPVTAASGSPTTIALLLGPASQLSAARVDLPAQADDPAVEADLRERADRLRGAVSDPFLGLEDAFDAID